MENRVISAMQHTLHQAKGALDSLGALIGEDIWRAVMLIADGKGRVVVTGLGKSGHIGRKIAATFSSLGIPALFLHPSEALHGDLGMLSQHDIVLALSSSGENRELVKVISFAKDKGNPVICITQQKDSSLAAQADIALIFQIEHEGSPFEVAPMASATSTLVLGHLLATGVSTLRGFTEKDFAALHPGGVLGLKLHTVEEYMRPKEECPLVQENTSFHNVLKEMTEKRNIGATGVISETGQLVGAISDGDIRRHFLRDPENVHCAAKDMMSRTPKMIAKDQTLYDAMALMEKHKITTLFVFDRTTEHVCGVIHMHDILQLHVV